MHIVDNRQAQMNNDRREVEILRKNQKETLKLKNTNQMKNAFNGFTSRLGMAGEKNLGMAGEKNLSTSGYTRGNLENWKSENKMNKMWNGSQRWLGGSKIKKQSTGDF